METIVSLSCHEGGVTAAALAAKNSFCATCGHYDRRVKVWNMKRKDRELMNIHMTAVPQSLLFSHDEHQLTVGSSSGAIKLFDITAGKEMRTLSGHKAKVIVQCQSPKSIYTWASGSLDNTVIIWDIRQHPAAVLTLRLHSKAVTAVQFSPDGAWLASGAEDCKAKLMDVRSGSNGQLAELLGHSAPITDIRFHPCDYLLASASVDKTVRFWDLETYECVTQSQPCTSCVRRIRFDREAAVLLTATERDLRAIRWEPFDVLGQRAFSAHSTLDLCASEEGVRLAVLVEDAVNVLEMALETLLTLPTSEEQSNVDEFVSLDAPSLVERERESIAACSLIDSLFCPTSAADSAQCVNRATRRSFGAVHSSVDTTEESSSDSVVTASADSSPVHEAMPSRRRHSKIRAKSSSSLSKSPSRSTVPLMCSEDDAFKKRDKLPRSRPQSPPSTMHFPPSQEIFDISVVSTAKASSSTTKQSKQMPNRSLERQHSAGRSVERKSSLTRNSTKSTTGGKAKVAAVQPLGAMGRKVEKVSPLPRPLPLPNIPGQVDRGELLPDEMKPEAACLMQSATASGGGGVDPRDFLPMQLLESGSVGAPTTTSSLAAVLSEKEMALGVLSQAQTMRVVLQHRVNAVSMLRQTWRSGGLQRAVDVVLQTNEQTLVVELLNALNSRSNLWSLHLCALLLPEIGKLLESKHEVYVQTAMQALRVIVANFGDTIRQGVMRTPSIGVDVPREERYERCKRCYKQLMTIRSTAAAGTKFSGRQSSALREVGVLTQLFDSVV